MHPESHPFVQLAASAGSGKTYALTSRFLDLLAAAGPLRQACDLGDGAGGYAWSDILAVTFTNKAAAEMHSRLLGALKDRALGLAGDDTPAGRSSPSQAAAMVAQLLGHAHMLNLRTIDSLLARIVLGFALELGLPPGVQASFDIEEFFTPLYEQLLAAARGDPAGPEADMLGAALGALLETGGIKGFWPARGLREALREVFERHLTGGPYFDDAEALRAYIADDLGALKTAALDLQWAIERGKLRCHKRLLDGVALCVVLNADDEPKESAYFRREGLSACLLAKSAPCDEEAEQSFADFVEAFQRYRRMRALCRGALGLLPFLPLARWLLERLPAQQHRLGMVPAQGWPQLVRDLLTPAEGDESSADGFGSAAEAFCRLGFAVRHLLIDEFQDTSRVQWQALLPLAQESLATGGSLLAVGDVKQAIYGWRGGESRLFGDILAEPALTALARPEQRALEVNWRSHRQVVEFNNAVFGAFAQADVAGETAMQLLADDCPEEVREALAADIATAFDDSRQQLAGRHAHTGGHVRLTRLPVEAEEDRGQHLRAALLELLGRELPARGVAPGQVAVLVRTNAQASQVASWLIDADIPVLTENSLAVASHPLVRQLVAFFAFLDFPPDDLALLQLLRGRELFADAAGLGQDTLAQWLASRQGPGLYRDLRRDFPDVWALLAPFLSKAGLLRPYDLAQAALESFAVLRRRPQDEPFARRFLELVHRAEERGSRTLAGFLSLWREGGQDERLPMPESAPAVRVMTVHKAKGLEFPVAVVPCMPSSGSGRGELLEFGPPPPVLTRLRKDMGPQYHQRRADVALEELHLLYVAWTRAVEELHILLPEGAKAIGAVVQARLTALGADDGEPVHGWGTPAERPAVVSAPSVPPPGAAADAAGVSSPREELVRWLPRLKVFRNFRPADESRTEAERGELYHAALEHLVQAGGNQQAVDGAVQAAVELFPQQAGTHGELRRALAWVLEQPELALAVAHGRAEAAFLDAEGAAHRVDLLHVTPQGVLVVDYKTGGSAGEVPETHEAQVRRYLRLAAEVFGRPAQGLLVYLDQRRLVRVGP